MRRNILCLAALSAGLALGLAAPGHAQSVTAAFQDFSGHSKEPVKIEADRLEVQESSQDATFYGNVVVVQGKSTLRTRKLTIEYLEKAKPGAKGAAAPAAAPVAIAAKPAGAAGDPASRLPTSSRDIRRLIADGNVVVTSGDQRATGSHGVFDMASNTVTLTGDVVLAQGGNVLRGDRLTVDLTTQRSKLESPRSGGRVQGVFVPTSAPEASGGKPAHRGGPKP
jgi:lipopolysaccharide export system protein LptA